MFFFTEAIIIISIISIIIISIISISKYKQGFRIDIAGLEGGF